MVKIIITCTKCGESKEKKHFQRESKEYKSCNDCSRRGKEKIESAFVKAFELIGM
jgi:NAD-dependent SIR2 family protein deacetylase